MTILWQSVISAAVLTALAPAFAAVMARLGKRLRERAGRPILAAYANHVSALTRRDNPVAGENTGLAALLIPIAVTASVLAAAQVSGLARPFAQPALFWATLFFGFVLLGRTATLLAAFTPGDGASGLAAMRGSLSTLLLEPTLFISLICSLLLRSTAADSAATPAAHVLSALAYAIAAGLRSMPPGAPDRLSEASGVVAIARSRSRRGAALLELAAQVRQISIWAAWVVVFLPVPELTPGYRLAFVAAALMLIAIVLGTLDALWTRGQFAQQQRRWPATAFTLAAVAFVIAAAAGAP